MLSSLQSPSASFSLLTLLMLSMAKSKISLSQCHTAPESMCAVQSLSCVRLCNPMNCSTPGFPVLHGLPELAQIHTHCVKDAIQPSHSLKICGLFPNIFWYWFPIEFHHDKRTDYDFNTCRPWHFCTSLYVPRYVPVTLGLQSMVTRIQFVSCCRVKNKKIKMS